MPGIGLNPSNCCCGACDKPTGLCVSIFNECDSDDSHNVEVTITGPDGSKSRNTGAGTQACFEDVKPGHYTIATAKEGCTTPSGSTDIACGDEKTINIGNANCSPGAFFEFSVSGCGGNPLPGAVCTISGADSGTCITDGDGNCSIPISHTGTIAWMVTHPGGRFASASGSITIFGLCEATGVGVSLPVADGFACCFPFAGAAEELQDNPYPISTSLLWTDCTGEYEFEIDPVGCGQDVCTQIPLDDVSLDGPSSCVTCTGGGTKQFPPTDAGVHPINVLLTLNFASISANIVKYLYRTYTGVGSTKFFNYKTGAACPDCGTDDASRSWRMDDTCENLADPSAPVSLNYETRASTSYVVNSVVPFNLTATINPAGNGYGPGAPFTPWSGSPPCGTVVISENL